MNTLIHNEPKGGWKPLIVCDNLNTKAAHYAEQLEHHTITKSNIILVLGGDGTMIKAIHEYYKLNLPFYGLNFGHVGFLLNEVAPIPEELISYNLPLLDVGWYDVDGWYGSAIAVNDAWVERASAQTARLSLSIDSICRLPSLYADGLLVSTPQGSTAYTRAMGGIPLPLSTNALQVVGSNVSFPAWKFALIDSNQQVAIEMHEKSKRPIRLLVDGVLKSDRTTKVVITKHQQYGVRLAFNPSHNLTEKIALVQFPK